MQRLLPNPYGPICSQCQVDPAFITISSLFYSTLFVFDLRDLMNTRSVVPEWLLDLLMGYLDPAAAHYSHREESYEPRQNWFDTFLSATHLRCAFPQYTVKIEDKRKRYLVNAGSGDHCDGDENTESK